MAVILELLINVQNHMTLLYQSVEAELFPARHKDVWGSGSMSPLVLILGIGGCVQSYVLQAPPRECGTLQEETIFGSNRLQLSHYTN